MGRKNGNNTKPQRQRFIRGNLPANRELITALRHPAPKAFGIRRPLEEEQRGVFCGILNSLQEDEDIPPKLELRPSLHVTLLSARTLGRQMMRGIAAGYELGQRSKKAVKEKAEQGMHSHALEVTRGEVRVYQGYSLYLQILSPEVEDEVADIEWALGKHGVKGFGKTNIEMGLHMSLGATKQSHRMSKTEQRHVIHVVEEKLPPREEPLLLQGWQVYP